MEDKEYKDYGLPTDSEMNFHWKQANEDPSGYLWQPDKWMSGAKWMRRMAVKAMDAERRKNLAALDKVLQDEREKQKRMMDYAFEWMRSRNVLSAESRRGFRAAIEDEFKLKKD